MGAIRELPDRTVRGWWFVDCVASFREDGEGDHTARVRLKGKRFADENAMPKPGTLSRVARDACNWIWKMLCVWTRFRRNAHAGPTVVKHAIDVQCFLLCAARGPNIGYVNVMTTLGESALI
jgi:hypothetical protein